MDQASSCRGGPVSNLRFMSDSWAQEHIFLQYLPSFSPMTSHSSIAAPWGVRYPWPGSTLWHPLTLSWAHFWNGTGCIESREDTVHAHCKIWYKRYEPSAAADGRLFHARAALYPGKELPVFIRRGWVGPSACLDVMEKTLDPIGTRTATFRPLNP
jgi:hypothetical protein